MQSTAFHKSRHLKQGELLDEHQKCPLCKSEELNAQIVLQDKPLVELCQCKHCNVCFASRFPTDSAISDYYKNYYSEQTTSKVTNDDYELFSSHIFSLFNKLEYKFQKDKTIKLLDYGGGDGSILLALAEKLVDNNSNLKVVADVVDFEPSLVKSNHINITIKKIDDVDIVENSYDFVVASAVLEHLRDPLHVSEKLISSIKNGGGIYIRTPYMLPIIKLLKSIGINLDFTFPAHLYDMGSEYWKWFSIRYDLDVIVSKPSKVETSFKKNFFRTFSAYSLKFPWYILRSKYSYVGGWEVVYRVNKQ